MNLALTPGEPSGIGPDCCIQLAQQQRDFALVAVADPVMLTARAEVLNVPLRVKEHRSGETASCSAGELTVLPISCPRPVQAGTLDPANANYVLETLNVASDGCVSGEFSALITGPVHKGCVNDAGIPFSGHTEYLAERTGGQPVMLLCTDELRVALATTHLPLRDVADAIQADSLARTIRIFHRDLQSRFGFTKPRIAVCGLNPHAGEQGHLGVEETTIIEPVLDCLRSEGLQLLGPLPADTAFTPPALAACDAVLAMYHDQGLTALKALGFGEAVNVTLGLPIIRTSVDHGTALSLAGTGNAKADSLQIAIRLAHKLAGRNESAAERLP